MKTKVGIFGTCRIDNYNFDDFIKKTKYYPYVYENNNFIINIRPLGYTTTTSDVLQNLSLIKNKKYLNIQDNFTFNNIFLKHGGKSFIPETNYDFLVLEICSLKKIINKFTNYIFPYEIEGKYNKDDFFTLKESKNETINNIIKIKELLNCKIILLPPIIEFNSKIIKGQHENTTYDKVLTYRKNILDMLKIASNEKNIYLIDWNEIIKKEGINKMLIDQFHFTEYGKQTISKSIINKINSFTN